VWSTRGLVYGSVNAPNTIVHRYSQSCHPTYALLNADERIGGGVCEAMCAIWVRERAAGRSLLNGLVRNNGNIDAPTFNEIASLQRAGSETDQSAYTRIWLEVQGGVAPRRSLDASGPAASAQTLGNAVTGNLASGAPFRMISLEGYGGHRVVAHVTNGAVVFFDPNYGEFSFPTPAGFRAWLASFWMRSMYFVGLAGAWDMQAYSAG